VSRLSDVGLTKVPWQ